MTLKHAQSNNFQILIEKMKKLHKCPEIFEIQF